MASVQEVKEMMSTLQRESAENMAGMMKELMKEVAEKFVKHDNSEKGDNEKINKPFNFKGEERKYHEWMVKLLTYLESKSSGSKVWAKWAVEQESPITDLKINDKYLDPEENRKVTNYSNKVQNILIGICEEEAFKIVQSSGSCGLESLRLLKKRFDPKNPGSKRALLKSLMNMPACQKISDVSETILKVEEMAKKFDDMTANGGGLPEDMIVCIMIGICSK